MFRKKHRRQAAVDPRPGAPAQKQRSRQGERREEIALVDPGGEPEEGDRHEQRGEQQAAHVVPARDLPQREQHDRDEQERPDLLPGEARSRRPRRPTTVSSPRTERVAQPAQNGLRQRLKALIDRPE